MASNEKSVLEARIEEVRRLARRSPYAEEAKLLGQLADFYQRQLSALNSDGLKLRWLN